jgi:hypothetical protein
VDKWILWYTYTHTDRDREREGEGENRREGERKRENGILFSHKKKNNVGEAGGILLSEISQTQEDKYFLISVICGIN